MLLLHRHKKRSFALTPEKVFSHILCSHLKKHLLRKELLSPIILFQKPCRSEAFFFAPLRGALTVEAAMVLPIFLYCMITAMQYCQVMETAVRLAGGLTDASEKMAASAYLYEYPEDAGRSDPPQAAVSALSFAWAHNHIVKTAGDTSRIKNMNMALSSLLQEGQMIDLVMTYQVRSPFRIVRLPGYFFLQRASVRAWTGRLAGNEDGEEGGEESGETVYVTETGSVYHEDPECTHLKLSVREVDRDMLGGLRNNSGGKYHACEKCKGGTGSTVYITNEGSRYHSSLTCSGLKRTVREITREEAANMRACSKCGNR